MRWPGRRGLGRRRVLVCSSGGVANLGDDAILVRTLARMNAIDPAIKIDVLTDESAPLPRTVPPPIGELREHVDLDLRGYRMLLIAGGGFACDWFGAHLGPRAALATRARREGVPVIVTGQGLGPLTDAGVARDLDALTRAADAFSVRDELSREIVRARGDNAVLTGDDALGLGARRAAGPRADVVLLHLRHAAYNTDDADALAAWARSTDALAAAARCRVVGFAVNDRPEAPETETLRAAGVEQVVDAARDPDALVAAVRSARMVVAHSYHVALFALEAGTPAVMAATSDYYAQKAEGLRRLAAVSDAFVATSAPTERDLAARFAAVQDDLAGNTALVDATRRVEAFFNEQCRPRLR